MSPTKKRERPTKKAPRSTKKASPAKAKINAQDAPEPSYPKTTRPPVESRRPEPTPLPSEIAAARRRAGKPKLDAVPDRIDFRDWIYQPPLRPLPDQIINCEEVPEILDQGREGACTGFALAANINFHLHARGINRRVSPRMLYEMARRYDEWPGENYEGSSARGGMKGWIAHGVCERDKWPDTLFGFEHLSPEIAKAAQATPGGAFYRVQHRQIRHMHAALAEVGIIYATLMVHSGWDDPGSVWDQDKKEWINPGSITRLYHYADRFDNQQERTIPVIQRTEEQSASDGHAIAIVGYTDEGFIIQNSWGRDWGNGGFAMLPYEDFLLHATDVWVSQLGVPIKLYAWEEGQNYRGMSRATSAIPVSEIRKYSIDVENNGVLSNSGEYWTTEEDIERLFGTLIPQAAAAWEKHRVMLFLHGGINDEKLVARRIVAFRDVLLANQIYPLHIMWESGFRESLRSMISDYFTDTDPRAGGIAGWLEKFREGLTEAKDRTFELTVSALGTKFWDEMKENARLASNRQDRQGGMQLLAQAAKEALKKVAKRSNGGAKKDWELHVVGHSAGSIFAAYALEHLDDLGDFGVDFKSFHLMAPAITVALFKQLVVPQVENGKCPHPVLYILSDVGERDDDVGPYGKSLLYLVSNAFEGQENGSKKGGDSPIFGTKGVPLLGMQRFINDQLEGTSDKSQVDPEMNVFFKEKVDGWPSLVVAGEASKKSTGTPPPQNLSSSDTHGGFDNDPDTLNAILYRILGEKPQRLFTERDLQYD